MQLTSGSTQTLFQQYGPAANILTVYNQTGQNITASIANSGSNGVPPVDPLGGWEGEEALDVEWAHAIAPEAKLDLIETNDDDSSGLPNLETGEVTAASLPGVSVISNSWGGGEDSSELSEDTTYFQHPGVTYLAATGDDGATFANEGLPGGYPAFSPNVVAVGGTTLDFDQTKQHLHRRNRVELCEPV